MNTALKYSEEVITPLFTEKDRLKHDNIVLFQHYLHGQKRLDEIAEGFRYALRIQNALLANESSIANILPDCFHFSLPKSELTGDFTWATRCGNRVIIAVADCTGHGVPGAMMSILGMSLMNQVVLEERCYEPAFILRRVDEKMRATFEQKNGVTTAYDGMDIALCCIDYSEMRITFSGAMRPMWLFQQGMLKQVSGSRYPIGGLRLEESRLYPQTTLSFRKGDTLYLFTDGYSDQFGGPFDKKMSRGRLRKLIHLIRNYSMREQREQVLEFFLLWKGNTTLTDDVTFAGIRL